ncbi:zinc metalloprotease HtpX [Candidatus Woesearchaeota archaeon]|nr:zinc metalloprotease HtpX [Candidatus Woesearchaeota archaeon]
MINQLKTVMLLASLTALLLWVGQLLGGSGGLLIAGIFAIVMNFGSYWFSDKIVLRMYRASEVKDTNHQLYKIVKEVIEIAKLPMPKVYIIPDQNANAFATGRNPEHAAVAATEGILNILNHDELKGVMAHEVAHIKNRDILISSVAGTIAGVISYVGSMAMWSAFLGRDRGNMAQMLMLAVVTPFVATIIQLAISRSREYIADATGADLVKNGESLASALEKLHQSAKVHPMRIGNKATAHMFISNPFSGRGMVNLLSTHPNFKERTRRLRAMKF